MKASLIPRAPLWFVFESDASECWLIPWLATALCVLPLQPISPVNCYRLGEPVSPRTAVSRAALGLKNDEFVHPQRLRGETKACRDWQALCVFMENLPPAPLTSGFVYLNAMNLEWWWHAAVPPLPTFLLKHTTQTSTLPTLVSCNYHLRDSIIGEELCAGVCRQVTT